MRSAPSRPRTSSVACWGRSVSATVNSIPGRSSRSTAASRSSVTPLANGLTISAARFIVASMPRLDHAAFETDDPDATASFYERVLGAKVVKAEGHPVMAYVGNTGFAFHERGGPGDHVGVRVSAEERAQIKRRLERAGIEY